MSSSKQNACCASHSHHTEHSKDNHTSGKCCCGHNHSHEAACAQQEQTSSSSAHQPLASCEHSHEETSQDEPSEHCHADDGGCSCGGGHSHDKPVAKRDIVLLVCSVAAFIPALLISNPLAKGVLFTSSALLAGYDLFWLGLKQLFKLKFEENVLLLIAVIASFALMDFPEACIVTILFKLGSFIESSAINRSKRNMEALTKIRPDYAYVKDSSGSIVSVDAKSVHIGDTIYLRAGDKIALDCMITSGKSSIDSSALTGESVPIYVQENDQLMSGSVNLSGLLECRVTKTFENSTASQIVDMVYQSSKKKGKTEAFITRLARVYTPIVMLLALLIAIVPPLLGIGDFREFLTRSLIFLVAACPCALVISIPLSFFSSIGAMSKNGVLVKGSMYIERLSKVTAAAFDKTGTLTSGELIVEQCTALEGYTSEQILSIAYAMESGSSHPIARAVSDYARQNGISPAKISSLQEHAGLGITADLSTASVACGGINLLRELSIPVEALPQANVYICINNSVAGYITVTDQVNPESQKLVKQLNDVSVRRVVMLTGDNEKSAIKAADLCGINEFYSGLLPNDKVSLVERLQAEGESVLFVGDGINDAPVLARADLGVSMGLGSEAANASSDIVLVSNRLNHIPRAISLAKQSMRVVYFNIYFALLVKIIVLALGATGLGTMWLAVFADIGVTILTVLNSIRLLRKAK